MNREHTIVPTIGVILVVASVLQAEAMNTVLLALFILMASTCFASISRDFKATALALSILLALHSIYLFKTASPSILNSLPPFFASSLIISLLIGFLSVNSIRTLRLILSVGILLVAAPDLLTNKTLNERTERGILNNGKWAYTEPGNSGLNIKSQYSYDILQQAIRANDAAFEDIDEYDELWLITPTKPFSTEEKDYLTEWIKKGGRLVLIADHTDLFGHQRVLNKFLGDFGIYIDDGAIIGTDGGGGHYFSGSGRYNGLTATTLFGFYTPSHYVLGYDDGIDYSKPSFFSDFRITSEDRFSAFPCSGFKRVGKGQIVFFGDSTLFSNFGISRPSSQNVLREICRGLYPNPIYVFFLIAVIIGLCTSFSRGMYIAFPLMLLTAWCCTPLLDAPTKLSWPEPTIHASGNWKIAEYENNYATALASSYALSPHFPVWSDTNDDVDYIEFNGRKIFERQANHRHIDFQQLIELLGDTLQMTVKEQLGVTENISYEDLHYGSFWFANGVGPIRENIFRRFWGIPNELDLVDAGQEYTCQVISKKDGQAVKVLAYQLNKRSWYLLGNGVIAKRLEDRFLVRHQWQAIPYHGTDLVLEIKK